MPHDLSLHSGERQTATVYEDIRADHRFRYEWAAERIPSGTFGVDVFCGNGYGTWLLGECRHVLGIDGSAEAIAAANQNFRRPNVLFSTAYYPFTLPRNRFDFAVCLESIEHVAEGVEFLRCVAQSLRPNGTLVFSTPCEDHLPHSTTGNHFHYKHYTARETLDLGNAFGLSVVEFAGQNAYAMQDGRQGPLLPREQMGLMQQLPGQFMIVRSRMRIG